MCSDQFMIIEEKPNADESEDDINFRTQARGLLQS
jgi:hypothetical protein